MGFLTRKVNEHKHTYLVFGEIGEVMVKVIAIMWFCPESVLVFSSYITMHRHANVFPLCNKSHELNTKFTIILFLCLKETF